MKTLFSGILLCLLALFIPGALHAQEAETNETFSPDLFDGLTYRMVGPYRGGRSTAVVGFVNKPTEFLMGTTGGGIWHTDDYGTFWNNISDGYFDVASIGAVEVALSDPSTIYVGTGSAPIRGNTSTGRGVYKSQDGGKTWSFIGLPEAGQIGKIAAHPRDENLVYVAALGHPFGKNEERGVFRSKDGGETWEHVLALSDSTGAVSLSMNPKNPVRSMRVCGEASGSPGRCIAALPKRVCTKRWMAGIPGIN